MVIKQLIDGNVYYKVSPLFSNILSKSIFIQDIDEECRLINSFYKFVDAYLKLEGKCLEYLTLAIILNIASVLYNSVLYILLYEFINSVVH